ncbi:MAG TPA: PQQ-binding-like beta-propeller repeat protein [Tepidisphaeraceae bacterium]|jgi:outer membrane protein assembly factor BamB
MNTDIKCRDTEGNRFSHDVNRTAKRAPSAVYKLLAGAMVVASGFVSAQTARAADWPMWGMTPLRNAVCPDKDPPTDWDVKTGKNILWSAALGSKSYGNPIVSGNMVFIGTNNEGKRDSSISADGGVMMAFDAKSGKFLFQRYSAKLPTGRVNDWPGEGECSTVYTEPGRLWYCTNRCEVVCLDLSPGAIQEGKPPKEVWSYDMMNKLGVFPHNMTSSAICAYKDYVYAITANGVDDTHKHVVAPAAPSIVCFNKNTGKVVWTDNHPGVNVLHGQWSSVAITEVNGRALVIAPLGDAWVYAFEAETGKIVWKFDMNPKNAVYPQTRNEVIATPCIVVDKENPNKQLMYIGNGQDPEHGEGLGHLYCVDITKTGDISKELDVEAPKDKGPVGNAPVNIQGEAREGKPNPNSGVVWDFEQVNVNGGKAVRAQHMNRTISTCVVSPTGLLYAPDFSGFLHCFDAKTGKVLWTYDMESAIWGSPLWVDGKIYITDEDGDVRIFADDKEMKKLSPADDHLNLGSASYCSPIFVNGIMYVMGRDTLYAIKTGAQSAPKADQ